MGGEEKREEKRKNMVRSAFVIINLVPVIDFLKQDLNYSS